MAERAIHAHGVVGDVAVMGDVAFAVERAAQQVREYRARVGRRRNPAVVVESVQRRDVVARDRAKVAYAGRDRGPALDAREQALDPGAVEADAVLHAVQRACRGDARAMLIEHRHEILGARKQKYV